MFDMTATVSYYSQKCFHQSCFSEPENTTADMHHTGL